MLRHYKYIKKQPNKHYANIVHLIFELLLDE